MRRLAAAFTFASLLVASSARAQHVDSSAWRPPPPQKRAFFDGKVTVAEAFELEKGRYPGGPAEGTEAFSILVIEDAQPTDPFPLADARAEIVPFVKQCTKYFAILRGPSKADVSALVGKRVAGAVSLERLGEAQKEAQAACVVADGFDHLLPGASRATYTLLRLSDSPGNLAQIERARAIFEPVLDQIRFYDQTPLDSAFEYALGDMKSREALELAMRMRMYSSIQRNFTWSHDPTAQPIFERALLESAYPRDDVHPYLAELYWHASETKARAKIAELVASRPALAASILEANLGWTTASSLFEELVDQKTIPFGFPHDLFSLGTEDAFLERHRADAASLGAELDKALAASKERSAAGIVDGWSLVRWTAKNKKPPRHDHGQRVTYIGEKAGCCELRARISDDVDLEVRAECDAETFKVACADKSGGARTATGVVKSVQYTTHRLKAGAPERPIVRVELETATVVDGGDIPSPERLDDVPTAATSTTTDNASPQSGCGCVVAASRVAPIAPIGALALAAALVTRRRRGRT